MKDLEYSEQQYLQSLERSLRLIRSGERLSLEASIEELCKVLLIQIYLERKSQRTLDNFVGHVVVMDDDDLDYYHELFKEFQLDYCFKGWDYLKLKLSTLMNVVDELTQESLFSATPEAKARAFTDFLQLHYSGYLSEYSTPQLLSEYIMDVIRPENLYSVADPCCGLGGLIVEAISKENQGLQLKGFDINKRIANTANLHLMMYGYEAGAVECLDMTETALAFKEGPFDVVVSHLPLRRRAYSVAGRERDMYERWPMRNQEDFFISQILKMLKPFGLAAVVVSDDLLMSEHREESRLLLYRNAQILNITRVNGLAYKGSSNERSYNVIFLRRLEDSASDMCTATLINAGTDEYAIKSIARSLRDVIYGESHEETIKSDIRYFHLMKESDWNVNLLFAREEMGNKYPTCQIREIAEHDRMRVVVEDSKNYKQLTVRNRGLGVVERKDEYTGRADAKTVRYMARRGQIIISSLEAEKGAVGVVPKELDAALVSRNYYLFTITNPRVDADYLAMVLSSKPVLRQLETFKRGRVMSRISIEKIKSLVIPLPDLDEQKKLVSSLMRKVKRVQQLQNDLEKEQTEFAWKLFGNDEV